MNQTTSEIDILKRKLQREKLARKQAEDLLEKKSLDLYLTNEKLRALNQSLEKEVEERTAQIKAGESKFKSIVENANDIIYRLNRRGEVTYVNAVGLSKIGYQFKEIAGTTFSNLVHPDYLNELTQFYQHQYAGRIESTYKEFAVLTKDKGLLWLGQHVQFIFEGRLLKEIIVFAKDMSEQKIVRDELLSMTSRLKTLIANLQTGILVEDENRKVVLSNQCFCDIFQIPLDPKDLIGTDCSQSAELVKHLFLDPEGFTVRISEILSAKQLVVNEELEMVNGRIFERDYIPIISENMYKGHLWQYRDITERKISEKQIRQSEEKYRGIIENMELGLMEVDNKGKIIRAYNRFCDMLGYTKEELHGKDANKILLPEEYLSVMELQDQQRTLGIAGVYEIELKKKDGSRIWVLISGAPFYNGQGEVVGSVGIHYDISERKKLEEDLKLAKKVAESARDAEKQFLANMSHEIRNPINAIIGVTNLLFDTPLAEEQLEYLNTIKFSSDILLDLISGILDLSKIESGQLHIEEKVVDLQSTVNAVIQTYKFKTAGKPIDYCVQIEEDVPAHVLADRTILNQIFLNLLGNAVKFTEKGAIGIKVRMTSETAQTVALEFEIWDTGIGIAEDKKEIIFQSFRQASSETQIKYGGTGLGLSIVKQLVSNYGGEIEVSSRLGRGSSFIFHMTFAKVEEGAYEASKACTVMGEALSFRKVLIVEDNKVNQTYLAGLLKKWGIEFNIAMNGVEALEFMQHHLYDLVLMDIRMPVMDGYETTIQIRSSIQNPNKDIPIIALTASALVDERDRALAAGMNHHLPKPFSPEQLYQVLEGFDFKNEQSDDSLAERKVEDKKEYLFSEQLDAAYLQEFYQHDFVHAQIMFDVFLEIIEGEVNCLHEAFTNKDWHEFKIVAHRIKPNFAMVGLTAYTELMLYFEDQILAESTTELLEKNYRNFVTEFPAQLELVRNEAQRIQKFNGSI